MHVSWTTGFLACLATVVHVGTAKKSSPAIEWYKCPSEFPKTIECGRIRVPLNHAEPDGKKITLKLARLPSTSKCKNSPVLFNENGGPGESNAKSIIGNAQNEAEGKTFSPPVAALREKYDFVGLDMRGTGYSEPIHCDPKAWNELEWPLINDEKTLKRTQAKAKAFGQSCVKMTGPLIQYMGTDQAVQDFEMVRRALKQEKFNYQGFSYGTELGSAYAAKYPERVGRMVLDGIVHESLGPEDTWLTNAIGMESTLDYFFRWCASSKECALHGKDAPAVFDTLYKHADEGKLFSNGCLGKTTCYKNRPMRSWELVLTVVSHLHDGITSSTYNPKSTTSFQAVSLALNSTFVENNAKWIPTAPITANSSSPDFSTFSELVISCADRPTRRLSASDFRNLNTVSRVYAPHSRGITFTQQRYELCDAWPTKPMNPPRALNLEQTRKLPPIMLVHSFYDPSTALPWALGIRSSLPTAFSVYRNGPGHTSFPHLGQTAWAEAAFLVNGTIPKDGQVYAD